MALVVYSGPVGGLSGSAGGNTYARNRFGYYVRNRTRPVNPNTARQNTVRQALAELTQRWSQVLTSAQRDAWNLYGQNTLMTNRLGAPIHPTGFNHYLRSNIPALQAGLDVVDDGPTIFELPEQDSSLAVTASEATQKISVAFNDALDWANEDDGAMITYGGSPRNAQRGFFAGPYRFMDVIAGAALAPPATPDVEDSPFAITQGQRLWVQARIRRADGRLSGPMQADCFCGA